MFPFYLGLYQDKLGKPLEFFLPYGFKAKGPRANLEEFIQILLQVLDGLGLISLEESDL